MDVVFYPGDDLLVLNVSVVIWVRESKQNVNLKQSKCQDLALHQRITGRPDVDDAALIFVNLSEYSQKLFLEDVFIGVHDLGADHLKSHVLDHLLEVFVIYDFFQFVTQQEISLLWVKESSVAHDALEGLKSDFASMFLASLGLAHVVMFKYVEQHFITLVDFLFINNVKRVFRNWFVIAFEVSLVYGSNQIDADGDELMPVNHLVFILISKSYHHLNVLLREAIAQRLEGINELLVRQEA